MSCQFSFSKIFCSTWLRRKPQNQRHVLQRLLLAFLPFCFLSPSYASAGKGDVDDILDGLIQTGPAIFHSSLAEDVEMQQAIYLDIAVVEEALLTGRYVELPLFDSYYLMRFDRTNPGTPGVITYMGDVRDEDDHQVGSILLTYGSGLFYGLISTGDGIYQIIPEKDDPATAYLLQKMKSIPARGITDFEDPQDPWVEPDQAVTGIPRKPLEGGGGVMPLSSNFTVDVLVLYTPSVRAGKGGTTPTNNWVNTIIADYNAKLTELGISSFTLSLKASLETTWPTFPTVYHENNTHNGTNACFVQNGVTRCDSLVADQYWVSTNSTVASLRNTYAADLVVLITADSQKHANDVVQGFAGLKANSNTTPATHGGSSGGINWGEFVTVRNDFALANLTLHHEVGHAFGLTHNHGAATFGWAHVGSPPTLVEQSGPTGHMKPYTIMGATDPVCLWSQSSTSSMCHMRLPYFAHPSKYRSILFFMFVQRVFDPNSGPLLLNRLEPGAGIVSQLK